MEFIDKGVVKIGYGTVNDKNLLYIANGVATLV